MAKSTKVLIWILAVMVVVALGCGGWYYFGYAKDGKSKNQAETSEGAKKSDSSTLNEYSDITASAESIAFANYPNGIDSESAAWRINLVKLSDLTATNKDFTTDFYLTSSGFESVYANNSVQWSKDGTVFAYSYGDEGGMLPAEVANSFKLILIKDGTATTVLENLEPYQIPKWKLMPDGKSIIYFKAYPLEETNIDDLNYAIYKYDIAAGTHTGLESDSSYGASSASPIFINDSGDTFYLVRSEDIGDVHKLYRFQFDLATNTESEDEILSGIDPARAFLGNFSETDVSISPDGTKVAYRYKISESIHGVALYNMTDSSSEDLYNPGEKKSVNNFAWTPDSKTLAFDTTYFGQGDGAGEGLKLIKIDVATNTPTTLAESTVSAGLSGALSAISWSPDGKKLAYTNESNLKYYNIDSSASVEVVQAPAGSNGFSLKGFEWVGY